MRRPSPRFYGAWERSALDDRRRAVADAGRAVWVQAGALFVDVRGPGGFASDTCFAGTTKWSEPYLTWTHLIDRAGAEDGAGLRATSPSTATTSSKTGAFIAGAERRVPRAVDAAAPARARRCSRRRRRDGLSVRVGDHAAAVVDRRAVGGAFVAAYWRLGATRVARSSSRSTATSRRCRRRSNRARR